MKVEKCCLCISIDTGVIVLYVLSILGIFEEIKNFNLVRTLTLAILLLSFTVMFFKNETNTRLATFAAYTVKCFIDTAMFFFVLKPEEGGYSVSTWAEHACTGMTAEDLATFNQEHGECKPAMEKYIFYATGVFFTLGAVITIHFILVLYTYWQDAVEEEEGKTATGGEEDRQPLMDN